jgi:hypothetical protein
MHGPGYAPPPPHRPSQGAQITLRVVFVALAVLSCGFAAWASMLRLALVTKRPRDWILFMLAIAHIVGVVVLLATDPGDEEFTTWRGDVGMSLLLGGMIVIVAYYLFAEIRHFSPAHQMSYTRTTGYSQPGTGYGFPAPQPYSAAHTPTPAPTPPPQPQPPVQQGPQPPQRPAPARIDQVRAELDELSDYLRKHEGDR